MSGQLRRLPIINQAPELHSERIPRIQLVGTKWRFIRLWRIPIHRGWSVAEIPLSGAAGSFNICLDYYAYPAMIDNKIGPSVALRLLHLS